MTQDNNSQVPWTDEQWARVNQVIQEEASRARVAATFLPLFGPLPASTDFVRREAMLYPAQPHPAPTPGALRQPQQLAIEDRDTMQLPTLQVQVRLRGAQMADPDMTSALALFRRAANVLARLEDAIVFRGQAAADNGPPGGAGAPPHGWEVHGGGPERGLFYPAAGSISVAANGPALVTAVSQAISRLEAGGYFGPFAVVLGQQFFVEVQTPQTGLVLPQDRIIPFLGGGPLLRSSTLPDNSGVVVALGGVPVELVVATDVSLQFLQLMIDPAFAFRVYEKMSLRIKEPGAIIALVPPGAAARASGRGGRGRTANPVNPPEEAEPE